jgi:dipeptidyl aminopeptidase/acylaminoacyl peptidase
MFDSVIVCARGIVAAGVLLPALLFSAHAASGPPAEDFTKPPAIAQAVISPSGKRVALRLMDPSGFYVAAVVEAASDSAARAVAAFSDADVIDIDWVNDDRLVFEARQREAQLDLEGFGTFAVNHDGSNKRQLTAWRRSNASTGTRLVERTLNYEWRLLRVINDGSDDVFVRRLIRDGRGDVQESTMGRLNTVSGVLTTLSADMPGNTYGWLFDEKNEPRVLRVSRDGRTKVYVRRRDQKEWQVLAEFGDFDEGGFDPLFLESDNELLVRASLDAGTEALYTYDIKARRLLPEAVARIPHHDLDGAIDVDRPAHKVVGLTITADRPTKAWFDERLARVQSAVDAALPDRYNLVSCGNCLSTTRFLVASGSDRLPTEYYLYEPAKATMKRLGGQRPWIHAANQGRRTVHRISARDGLELPVYVTHPPGAAPNQALPTVVILHGGPWSRGSDLSWDAEAQFLASRGYRVLEPEFRGSTGYGYKHFRVGWKAWGTGMQDDVKDAVDWAVKQGLTDSSRVCLYGASYGGYAALMGPIRHPQAYRCAASFVGVTDIELMFTSGWSDLSVQWKSYGLRTLVGNPDTELEMLRTASPLRRAAEIQIPVLLAHGGKDRRVPIAHARQFESAAKAAGVKLEVIDYPHEGHGWFDPDNHTDFLNRLDGFLARSLKP